MGNDSRPHYIAFRKKYGNGPYVCDFCNKRIDHKIKGELVRHHVDGDHSNNAFDNLVPMHRICHLKAHHVGDEERRTKISESMKRRWADPEFKEKQSQAMKPGHENCNCTNHVKHRAKAGWVA